ncbi:hypothetical protein COEREDRAFT_85992 [Coemansia reversa NRRL 1564]|uniref:Uncharacterized protein n=1 Tax=Coemansia reversa (strain ATCC 12441 / NRRL 1564) TaxID=763665 RepID=A0A2G5BFC7_COERN|nr:hypothetical protein COEREDRAFT_85992 [Coemansia reversa NRRL 1564]|eukprot:PIA17728.1 hypothetical protein COEREDRAFT_85992 [Coemansia reversa NRRL 1564]
MAEKMPKNSVPQYINSFENSSSDDLLSYGTDVDNAKPNSENKTNEGLIAEKTVNIWIDGFELKIELVDSTYASLSDVHDVLKRVLKEKTNSILREFIENEEYHLTDLKVSPFYNNGKCEGEPLNLPLEPQNCGDILSLRVSEFKPQSKPLPYSEILITHLRKINVGFRGKHNLQNNGLVPASLV